MNFLRRFWNWLMAKDLPSSVVKEPETETEKILKDKPLMKAIRESRKRGSTSSPYEPLVVKTEAELKEEEARREWLPESTVKRRIIPQGQQSRKHHDVGRFMKGGRYGKHQKRTLHDSKNIDLEEEA